MASPQISIIMATYNRAHFIAEMLMSIQNQSFKDFECIIIDDGGTDNTAEVIAPCLEDIRFTFQRRTDDYNKGLPGCRNCGIDLAKGDYFIFFDDDDLVHQDCLQIAYNELAGNTSLSFCHYQKQSFKNVDEVSVKSDLPMVKATKTTDAILYQVVTSTVGFASCTVLWKSECFNEVRFIETLQYAEEWECYSKILSENSKGVIINAVTYFNRKHPASNTGEFYQGDSKRVDSKIAASKLIITNLNEKQLFTGKFQKFFAWQAVQLNDYSVLRHINRQSSVTGFQKLKATALCTLSPLIKIYLRSKKNA